MTQTNNERVDVTPLEQINAVQSIRNAETLDDALRVMNGLAANGWLRLWDNATHPDGTSYRDKSPISHNEQQEPFGYFKAEPFGWTDCAETEEGAIPLYESPPKQAIPEGWVKIKKDAERYRWLREVSRDPDESSPHCVVTEEVLEKGKPAKMVSYLVFDEKLDAEIDKMINAAPTNTEVGE